MKDLKVHVKKAAKALWRTLPVLVGVVLLVSLAHALVPVESYTSLFRYGSLIDSFIGSALGSIFAGNPVVSYVLGGELLKQGISLFAVTAFLVAWVTVGVVQLPAEAILLGKKFAIVRNSSAFLLSVLVAFVTVWMVSLL